MAQKAADDTQMSLEKIKKRLTSASSSCFMEGALLKRSETLRKWNQRWFTLDPTTGKMEYRMQQGDQSPRGLISFEPDSTITLSPINFHGARKYDGCCFYVGTPQKKEYYLCAETPTIARAWVSTLRAATLVLKAHREAVDSLSGNGHAKLGTVAAVVAAANATAREGMKEMQQSMKAALMPVLSQASHNNDATADDVSTVMKETLRVKDEELNQVARDLRARDYMIKEMADRLSETAEAAEAAASAARLMEKERKRAQAELESMKKEFSDRLYGAACEVRAGDERLAAALKAREIALQEAQRWRVELGKGREQIVMMEAAVVRAEDAARRAAAAFDEKLKASLSNEVAALAAKEQALNEARQWKAQADYYQAQASRYMTENRSSPVSEAIPKPRMPQGEGEVQSSNGGPPIQESNLEPSAEKTFSDVRKSEQTSDITSDVESTSDALRSEARIPVFPVEDGVPISPEIRAPVSPVAHETRAPMPPEVHASASPEVRPLVPMEARLPVSREVHEISPDLAGGPAMFPEASFGEEESGVGERESNVSVFPTRAGVTESGDAPDKNLNYITAVDFEQLQSDMFNVQRASLPTDSTTSVQESGAAPKNPPSGSGCSVQESDPPQGPGVGFQFVPGSGDDPRTSSNSMKPGESER